MTSNIVTVRGRMQRGFLCSSLAIRGSGACLLTGMFTVDYCNITEGTIKGNQLHDKHTFTHNTPFDVMLKREIQLNNTAPL